MLPMDYRYCPLCAAGLEHQEIDGRPRPTCPACGFIHFQDPKVAVVALIPRQNDILLIRRRFGHARGRWALPGGFLDPGEMPEDALRREVREEVGLTVSPKALLDMLPMEAPGAGTIGIVIAYLAWPAAPPGRIVSGDDADAARWFSSEALPEALAFKGTRRLVSLWRQHHAPAENAPPKT
jgi:mutator protein MutT